MCTNIGSLLLYEVPCLWKYSGGIQSTKLETKLCSQIEGCGDKVWVYKRGLGTFCAYSSRSLIKGFG